MWNGHRVGVPGWSRVRWDSAMFTGANVPPYYDSMLGKLIVCAPTRDGAIRRCARLWASS